MSSSEEKKKDRHDIFYDQTLKKIDILEEGITYYKEIVNHLSKEIENIKQMIQDIKKKTDAL